MPIPVFDLQLESALLLIHKVLRTSRDAESSSKPIPEGDGNDKMVIYLFKHDSLTAPSSESPGNSTAT